MQHKKKAHLKKLSDRCAHTPETFRKALLPFCWTISPAETVYPSSRYMTLTASER